MLVYSLIQHIFSRLRQCKNVIEVACSITTLSVAHAQKLSLASVTFRLNKNYSSTSVNAFSILDFGKVSDDPNSARIKVEHYFSFLLQTLVRITLHLLTLCFIMARSRPEDHAIFLCAHIYQDIVHVGNFQNGLRRSSLCTSDLQGFLSLPKPPSLTRNRHHLYNFCIFYC